MYLGKDLSKVTLPDAALLAGMIQAPSGEESVPPSGARQGAPQYRC